MELGQPETVGMLDDHQIRIENVDADLDDRGGDKKLNLAVSERRHGRGLLAGRHAPVQKADGEVRELRGEFLGDLHSGLGGDLV